MIGLFGVSTKLHHLQEVPITGAQGERLCLSYKLSILYVGVPLFLTRDGYVLGIHAGTTKAGQNLYSNKNFYPLTDSDVQRWQVSGHLPNPLPPYKLSIGDHIEAYWAVALFGVLSLLSLFVL
jgi:hypothetical protein